ncbi:winged helix DNA-binding domain-containing protein [Aggregatilinea lenta]|uniref:winged helix DNA-binding domain-containing protein n=1 Tax=Aggregatilinea lenta TaxID=913108 RepID=UPI0013C2CD6A|nr:winged helix DNA-binding domain-containing protein [Aggregatilinea lenta]
MPTIAWQRLYNQHLEGPKLQRADEVVAWFGAVQAQEYALAKWALGQRLESATNAALEQAFNDGAILRTHVMRPTWHFVAPADIRWLLALTRDRVHRVTGTMYRRLELDEALMHRCGDILARALEGGHYFTRPELGSILADAGIDGMSGIRLTHIMMFAELEGVVCSGPRQGKQHTYALLDERAPGTLRLSRDDALAELTRRFFTSHGPATVKDFAFWSGLTIADVKAGLAMLDAQLAHDTIDGQEYWFAPSAPLPDTLPARGHLLPVYDEYTIPYKGSSSIFDPHHVDLFRNRLFTSAFVQNGAVAGMWRRTFERQTVVVECESSHPFTPAETDAFNAAAQRFGDFLGLPVDPRLS